VAQIANSHFAQREKILGVPQKQKINLEKVMASLNTVCPKCGCSIAPDRIRPHRLSAGGLDMRHASGKISFVNVIN
jgi:hypothetical protein